VINRFELSLALGETPPMMTALAIRSAASCSANAHPAPAGRRAAALLSSLQSTCRRAAHDLRAPLNAMSINLDLVRQIVDQDSDRLEMRLAARERIAILQAEVTRLARMLTMLAEGGAPRRDPDLFGLDSLLREVAGFVEPQAARLGIHVSLRLSRRRLAVAGARDEFKQALINLLMNAFEAMPQGGPLEIELTREGARAVVQVRDHGTGIASCHLDRIFQLHFTTKPAGSGIGLFTSRAAIEAMGGELTLHSREGLGTTARIALPIVSTLTRELACSMS
jgi:signal transduction histidine kinase